MANKQSNKGGKFSAGNIIAVIAGILIFLILSYWIVTEGILEGLMEAGEQLILWISNKSSEFVEDAAQFVGINYIDSDLHCIGISQAEITELKEKLENESIDTEVCGLTEVRMRKMILATLISNSFSDTLCVSDVSEDDIVKNIQKHHEEITTFDEFKNYCKNNNLYVSSENNNYFNFEGQAGAGKYELFLEEGSNVFFYFYDANGYLASGEAKWYLGGMGKTKINVALDGTSPAGAMQYYEQAKFEKIKENYEQLGNLFKQATSKYGNNVQFRFTKKSFGDAINSALDEIETGLSSKMQNEINELQNTFIGSVTVENWEDVEREVLKAYTWEDEANSIIKVYTIKTTEPTVRFKMSNGEETIKETGDVCFGTKYEIVEKTIDLKENTDMSQYSIPMELLVNFLNLTGSGDFVDRFIDYALNSIEGSVTVYNTVTESKSYVKNEFNINSDFVLEMYDFMDYGVGDVGFDIAEVDNVDNVDELSDDSLIFVENTLGLFEEGSTEEGITWEAIKSLGSAAIELVKDSIGTLVVQVKEGALKGDNFKAYYKKTFNREGLDEKSVVSIPNFESDDDNVYSMDGQPREDNHSLKYVTEPLKQYLKLAFDPSSTSSYNIKVIEGLEVVERESNKTVMQTEIKTWYQDIVYDEPTIKNVYTVGGNELTEEEYEDFGLDDVNDSAENIEDKTEREIFIWDNLVGQVGEDKLTKYEFNQKNNSDIFDDFINLRIYPVNTDDFGGRLEIQRVSRIGKKRLWKL